MHSLLRGFSSAGSEHLPYKQRVGGSNPSTPTKRGCFQCFQHDSPSFFDILRIRFVKNWINQIIRLIQRESKFFFTTDHTGFTEKNHGIVDPPPCFPRVLRELRVKKWILFSKLSGFQLEPCLKEVVDQSNNKVIQRDSKF